MSHLYRLLPSVDEVLKRLEAESPDLAAAPRAFVRDLVNDFLDIQRADIKDGSADETALQADVLHGRLTAYVTRKIRPHFTRVLNATGVVIHTNLGRSLLAESAISAVADACRNYSNLEFDLATGGRGSRYSHVEELLCRITGAEAGLVVNNNASAVLLCLETLAKGREAIVSRGQLVEIGGSFRIPDVMARSGATLVEVGATNRTHPRDYENAITDDTALLLKVHASNFRIIGFTKETSLEELVAMGRPRGIPVMEDLGSGSFTDFHALGIPLDEPTVQQTVASGADVVTFSGDKVLGGPQAGLIVGRREYIDRIKRNPINRAMRIDKMTLAALEATLRLYLEPERARREIPTLAMITADAAALKTRARRLCSRLRRDHASRLDVNLRPGSSRVGGGSFPEFDLPTTLVAVNPLSDTVSVSTLKERLLDTDPPLIGRLEDDAFCLDVRTLRDDEFALVSGALGQGME